MKKVSYGIRKETYHRIPHFHFKHKIIGFGKRLYEEGRRTKNQHSNFRIPMTRTCILENEVYKNNRCWKLKKRIVHNKKYNDGLALEPNKGLV